MTTNYGPARIGEPSRRLGRAPKVLIFTISQVRTVGLSRFAVGLESGGRFWNRAIFSTLIHLVAQDVTKLCLLWLLHMNTAIKRVSDEHSPSPVTDSPHLYTG